MPRAREPDPTAGLFEAGHKAKRIARLLDKAVDRRIAKAARGVPKMKVRLPGGGGRKAQRSALAGALAKAIGVRRGGRDKPSLRVKAPDTGGRSFHFEHTTVTKGQAHTATKKAKGGGSTKGMGAAAAHLAYIEREGAVETLRHLEGRARERELDPALLGEGMAAEPARRRGRPSREELRLREAARERGEGWERGLGDGRGTSRTAVAGRENELEGRGKEREGSQVEAPGRALDDFGPALKGDGLGGGKGAAAQAYIENPAKMRNGEMILSSFGTIGETYEERLEFWRLLEEHEREPDARIQSRLICELPHQSTPEARKEILERFVKPLADKGIPYHVAVHAPGAKNDSRNFHAHVVFTERPARRMIDPETGVEGWDFAIERTFKSASRNVRTNHPYRQPKDRDLNKKSFVGDMRKHFAASVNAVMAGVDASVRFDPRSYAAMGVGVAPVESVIRVAHDRMNDGKLVIQDVHWTRRMVEAKMREAALARDPDMEALRRTTASWEALKADWPHVHRMNARLGPSSRIVSLGTLTRATFVRIVNQRLSLEHALAREKVVAKAELAVCWEVMEATRVQKVKAVGRRDLRTPEEQEELRDLFDVAKEEHAALRARLHKRTFDLGALLNANKEAWRSTVELALKPVKIAPAPERPDPRTGKVMFEPDLAARAARPLRLPETEAAGKAKAGGAKEQAPQAAWSARPLRLPEVEAAQKAKAGAKASNARPVGPASAVDPAKEKAPHVVGRMMVGDVAPRVEHSFIGAELRRAERDRAAAGAAKGAAASPSMATGTPKPPKATPEHIAAWQEIKKGLEMALKDGVKAFKRDLDEERRAEPFKPFDVDAYLAKQGQPSIENLRWIEAIMGMEPGSMARNGAASRREPGKTGSGKAEPRPGGRAGAALDETSPAATVREGPPSGNAPVAAPPAATVREAPRAETGIPRDGVASSIGKDATNGRDATPTTGGVADARGAEQVGAGTQRPVRRPVPSWDFGMIAAEPQKVAADVVAKAATPVEAPATVASGADVARGSTMPQDPPVVRRAVETRMVEEGDVGAPLDAKLAASAKRGTAPPTPTRAGTVVTAKDVDRVERREVPGRPAPAMIPSYEWPTAPIPTTPTATAASVDDETPVIASSDDQVSAGPSASAGDPTSDEDAIVEAKKKKRAADATRVAMRRRHDGRDGR